MGNRRKSAYCTTREAAKLLGVSLRTAQLWSESGILEAWKTEGGHRRIAVDSVQRLLDGELHAIGRTRDNEAPEISPAEPERLRVLVVEDDNVLLKLYRMRIAAWGLPVELHTAGNGYEGLVLIGREMPDLMISDLHMPGIDGFRMIRTLYHSAFREGMEIVVVTGLDEEAIRRAGGLPENLRVLPKPIPFDELRGIAESLLARRAALTAKGASRSPAKPMSAKA